MPVDLEFRALGCESRILAFGIDESTVHRGRERIEELEAAWSRFRPESELSRLNRSTGNLTVVSADTFLLLQRSVEAWRVTGGGFDPTVLRALLHLGYDRSFELLETGSPTSAPERAAPSPGCQDIELFEAIPAVVVPPGVLIDPGGIGKGLAADIVAGELMTHGATGVAVDLGGDVRVAGTNADSGTWTIEIEDPRRRGQSLAAVTLAEGAVATSSTLRRNWPNVDGGTSHHLVDPATGRPFESDIVQISVIAGEGWWAEALTKAAFATASGSAPHPADLHGNRALVLGADGVLHDTENEEIAA